VSSSALESYSSLSLAEELLSLPESLFPLLSPDLPSELDAAPLPPLSFALSSELSLPAAALSEAPPLPSLSSALPPFSEDDDFANYMVELL